MGKRLEAWDTVKRPGAVRRLPPYTFIPYIPESGSGDKATIMPDIDGALEAVDMCELPNADEVDKANGFGEQAPDKESPLYRYRGLALRVNDHGNITLLMYYRNGNTREIWSAV